MKNEYQNFTVSLALFDSVPVILFIISTAIISTRFNNIVFIIGTIISSVSGILKVIWKFLVSLKQKDIVILNKQMRKVMPIGFSLMLLSFILFTDTSQKIEVLKTILAFPSIIFYALFTLLMSLMGYFGKNLDSHNYKSNWLEQSVNALGQLSLLIGIILSL